MIFHVDLAQFLTLAVSIVLPLLTGWVTKSTASGGVRAVVLLVLSGVTGFLGTWLDAVNTHTQFDAGTAFVAALGTFLVGVGMHLGIWKSTGISDAVKSAGGFIGPQPPVPPAPAVVEPPVVVVDPPAAA